VSELSRSSTLSSSTPFTPYNILINSRTLDEYKISILALRDNMRIVRATPVPTVLVVSNDVALSSNARSSLC